MTPRTWCQLAISMVFCAVAVPVVIGILLLLALIPGCRTPWVVGVTWGALLSGSVWLLAWVLGEVGAQWDRL